MNENDSKPHKNDGERLRLLRRALGLTQAQLAARLGCSKKTISNHENAKYPISREQSRLFGKVAQVDIAPFDPNEDPYLALKRYYEFNNAKPRQEKPCPQPIKATFKARILQLRANSIVRNRCELTPIRRAYENTVNFICLAAAAMFLMEQFQRAIIGGWDQHQAYHDALLLGSLALILLFALPSLQTIAWGVKPSDR